MSVPMIPELPKAQIRNKLRVRRRYSYRRRLTREEFHLRLWLVISCAVNFVTVAAMVSYYDACFGPLGGVA